GEPHRSTGVAVIAFTVGRSSTIILTADERCWVSQIIRPTAIEGTTRHVNGGSQTRIAGIGKGCDRTAGMATSANLAGIQLLVIIASGTAVLRDQPINRLAHLIS